MGWSIKAYIYADGSFLFRELWGYFLSLFFVTKTVNWSKSILTYISVYLSENDWFDLIIVQCITCSIWHQIRHESNWSNPSPYHMACWSPWTRVQISDERDGRGKVAPPGVPNVWWLGTLSAPADILTWMKCWNFNNNNEQLVIKQECIPVWCVPSAAVAVCWGCLPRGGVFPGGCIPACTGTDPPMNRMTDRQV